jgi:hypothetical protein
MSLSVTVARRSDVGGRLGAVAAASFVVRDLAIMNI